ncbi:methyl-accepting chemotaxis protein [uncultured Roseobacter sp.]|uniref:methyl-accepting chemotaxis protein n=1 Tax=uncultured Roseobacter sp. TaxID=114847 RepID=UPI00261F1A4D|nr:methyl-accepting chemotaxis protein [uncultured Roseobacter sp.]
MSANAKRAEVDQEGSLEHTLHQILGQFAPLRVAALQILIYHIEGPDEEDRHVTDEEFMAAAASLDAGCAAARALEAEYFAPHDLTLPTVLAEKLADLTEALQELVRITSRCSLDDKKVKGFNPSAKMYDLCCLRVANGVSDFSTELGYFFLELNDKGRADALDHTSSIAMEIGKIGRVINMVATNASIEAARVGDAGKGFTVIADEVKALSSRVSSLSVSLTERNARN